MLGSTRKLGLLAALLSTLVVAACSSGSTASTPADGEPLVVYSGRSEELVGPLFTRFTEETGIPVSARYGDSAELAAQLIEEGDGTPAQVYFSQDAGALGAVAAEGLLAPLPEGTAAAVPAQYQSTDGTWTGVTGRARVIAYDPEQVAPDEVPTTVLGLTDPRWNGQVAIAPTNASFQSFVTAMRRTEGDEATKSWLEGLVANDVQTYEKNGLILDAVDAGQVQLGLVNHYYWYEKAAEVGADAMRAKIAFTAPGDPGSLVNVAGVGVTGPAAGNPHAAEFVAWLLTPEVQQWFVENTFEYPLVPAVATADGLPALESLSGPDVALADLADLPGTLDLLAEVGLL
ncbi:MAG: iron ABC transporter substrate-binding protein [Actinomycetota bacterium]|nr:iron ABC transporter substrate-binding protein [Actinomycetota bacterium]